MITQFLKAGDFVIGRVAVGRVTHSRQVLAEEPESFP
jgi:hypothetical protein